MKVLHVSSGNLYGGVGNPASHAEPGADGLPGDGTTLRALLPGAGCPSNSRRWAAPHLTWARCKRVFPWQIWWARRQLAHLLRTEPVDVVVCHMPWAQAIFGPVVRRAKKLLVFWMHDAAEGKHWIERWAARCPPDLAVCNSRFTAGSLSKLFPRATPLHEVIFYPVTKPAGACVNRAAVRAALGTPPDACVIIQVSRMEPYKGATLHLEALARLANVPGWEGWFVGGVQRPHEAAFFDPTPSTGETRGDRWSRAFPGSTRGRAATAGGGGCVFASRICAGSRLASCFIEALYAGAAGGEHGVGAARPRSWTTLAGGWCRRATRRRWRRSCGERLVMGRCAHVSGEQVRPGRRACVPPMVCCADWQRSGERFARRWSRQKKMGSAGDPRYKGGQWSAKREPPMHGRRA